MTEFKFLINNIWLFEVNIQNVPWVLVFAVQFGHFGLLGDDHWPIVLILDLVLYLQGIELFYLTRRLRLRIFLVFKRGILRDVFQLAIFDEQELQVECEKGFWVCGQDLERLGFVFLLDDQLGLELKEFGWLKEVIWIYYVELLRHDCESGSFQYAVWISNAKGF